MSKSAFEDILRRYIDGETTEEESAYVEKWYEGLKEKDIDSVVPSINEDKEEIYLRIRKVLFEDKKPTARIIGWSVRIAASIIFIAGIALFYQYLYNKNHHPHEAVTLVPGSDKATLTLADGSVLLLDQQKLGDLGSDGGANISKPDSGTIVYTASRVGTPVQFNTIHTPTGGQFSLILPDGTKIWLNSVTTLKFPTRFTGKERRVTITGEAYFEVAKNKDMPFVVDIPGKQSVTVLGTHFNVSAYDDDEMIRTTLAEGSVRVHVSNTRGVVVLKPGQQSVAVPGQPIVTLEHVDLDQVLAWKEGYFSFNRTNISEIAKQFSRWYGAEVVIDPDVKNQTFSGRIPRSADIQKVLKILETTNTVNFSVIGKQIKIYLKK